MLPRSAKAKGAVLQKWVRDKILSRFPELEKDDVRSTSAGVNGEDVQLSPAARKLFPFQIECKNLAKVAVYSYYVQAMTHGHREPVVFIKQNGSKPLAIVDAEWFINNVGKKDGSTST